MPQPFFPKSSNIGQRFIPSWLIISVEIKNLLDTLVTRFVGFDALHDEQLAHKAPAVIREIRQGLKGRLNHGDRE
jgi:hypothetical protein